MPQGERGTTLKSMSNESEHQLQELKTGERSYVSRWGVVRIEVVPSMLAATLPIQHDSSRVHVSNLSTFIMKSSVHPTIAASRPHGDPLGGLR